MTRGRLVVEDAIIEGATADLGPFVLEASAEAHVAANRPGYGRAPVLHDSPTVSLTADADGATLYLDLGILGTSFGELPAGSYDGTDPVFDDVRVWFGTERPGTLRVGGEAIEVQMEIEGPPDGRRTVSLWAFVYFQPEPIHAVFDVTEVE